MVTRLCCCPLGARTQARVEERAREVAREAAEKRKVEEEAKRKRRAEREAAAAPRGGRSSILAPEPGPAAQQEADGHLPTLAEETEQQGDSGLEEAQAQAQVEGVAAEASQGAEGGEDALRARLARLLGREFGEGAVALDEGREGHHPVTPQNLRGSGMKSLYWCKGKILIELVTFQVAT